MSYLYDSLAEALGGKRCFDSKGTRMSNWTPNNYKTIIITRGFILCITHMGQVIVKQLDMVQVENDIQEMYNTNRQRGKLNELFSKRSFSCLEELYVDSSLNIPFVINLNDLANKLFSKNSRLRRYGYTEFNVGMVEYIKKLVNQINREPEFYSLSLADSRWGLNIKFIDCGNIDWYTKYYLRPQYYTKDAEKGNLAVYFRKVEEHQKNKGIEDGLLNKKQAQLDAVFDVMLSDLAFIDSLKRFNGLVEHLVKCREELNEKLVYDVITSVLKNTKPVKGFNKENLSILIGDKRAEFSKNPELMDLCKLYTKFGILDKSNNESFDFALPERKELGFIKLPVFLDKVCYEIGSKLKESKSGLIQYRVAMLSCPLLPIEGKFQKSNNHDSLSDSLQDCSGYFDFIGDIIGREV